MFKRCSLTESRECESDGNCKECNFHKEYLVWSESECERQKKEWEEEMKKHSEALKTHGQYINVHFPKKVHRDY